jgi:hypothetical protein
LGKIWCKQTCVCVGEGGGGRVKLVYNGDLHKKYVIFQEKN